MKLSDAIREGAALSVQAFGAMFRGGATCALGAACEWVQYVTGAEVMKINSAHTFFQEFPIADTEPGEMPCGCVWASYRRMDSVIAHLNDFHKWSREAIAEWVEVQENTLLKGDKGEDAKGVTNSPPPCAHEDVKDCTPAEVTQ